jgi:hypothetical protein
MLRAASGAPLPFCGCSADASGPRPGYGTGPSLRAGGMTDAVPVPADAVPAAHFTHLGSVYLA